MSYTTNRQPQGIGNDIEGFIREAIIAETVAINDYSDFISMTDNRELKELFHHIMEDEKRHYAMFLECLRNIDQEEKELAKESKNHVKISNKIKYKDYINKCDNENTLVAIRKAVKGELEAILLYKEIVVNIDNDYIRKIVIEIIKDEKEHTEELTRALVLLDKDEYGSL